MINRARFQNGSMKRSEQIVLDSRTMPHVPSFHANDLPKHVYVLSQDDRRVSGWRNCYLIRI